MKRFAMAIVTIGARSNLIAAPEHVAMAFEPGGVLHLSNNRIQCSAIAGVAEEQVERAEIAAECPQLGQQADRAGRHHARLFADQLANALLQRLARIAEMISAQKSCRRESACGEYARARQPRHFRQVQKHHVQPVVKAVVHGLQALVSNDAVVEAAFHCSKPSPKCPVTFSALLTPSSWNPYPRYAPQK